MNFQRLGNDRIPRGEGEGQESAFVSVLAGFEVNTGRLLIAAG